MSAELEKSSGSMVQRPRQPLWPWLLMPLVTLAIFLALRNARQAPPPQVESPQVGAAVEDAAPAAQPR
jgi:hypothetical protein